LRRAAVEGRQSKLGKRPWFDGIGQPFTVYVRRVGESVFSSVDPASLRIVNLEDPPAAMGARPAATQPYTWFEAGDTAPEVRTGSYPIVCAIDPVTGRIVMALPPSGTTDVEEVRVAHAIGRGRAIGAGAQERGHHELPFEIRDVGDSPDLVWIVDPSHPTGGSAETGSRTVPRLADALAEVAAQGAGHRSFVLLTHCDFEGAPTGSTSLELMVPAASEVQVVAAEWRTPATIPGVPADPELRGFIVRRERRFTMDAPLRVARGSGPASAEAGRVLLDGLELTKGMRLGVRSVSHLTLRHLTLRSPGAVALTATGTLAATKIAVDASICGPIRLGTDAAPVSGALTVCDSIIAVDGASGEAITAPGLDCTLRNVTVLGPSSSRAITTTNVVFTEPVTVTRRQSGCVRYSFVPEGSTIPRTFRSQPGLALGEAEAAKGTALTSDEATTVQLSIEPVLMDDSLDEPTLAMLHPLCPDAIRLGGEDECEMGAFARSAFGIASANLSSLFDDYVPTALQVGIIDDTRSAAIASRRDVP
jgi:hypothetical protein